MEIRLYEKPTVGTTKLQRLGITNKTDSSYEIMFCDVGKFTIKIHALERYALQMTKNRIVQIDKTFWGVIKNRNFVDAESVMLTVTGESLNRLLADRVTLPDDINPSNAPVGFDSYAGSTEALVKHYVKNNTEFKRRIPLLTVAPNQNRGLASDKHYSRFENLSELIIKKCSKQSIGYRVQGSQDKFEFDVTVGTDRTSTQRERSAVIFDVDDGTAKSFEYNEDTSNEKTVFYCTKSGSDFEDEAFTQTYWDGNEPSGLDRIETHLNISVESGANEYAEMDENARAETQNYKSVENFKVENSRYEYGKDFFEGDFVTARNKPLQLLRHVQIKGVTVSDTPAGKEYSLIFGEFRKDKLDLLNQKINNK